MLHKLLATDIDILEKTIKRGSFSIHTFCIHLNTTSVEALNNLSDESKATLCHELGHMFHYLTTYLGLIDMRYWIASLSILMTRFKDTSPEEQSSIQSGFLLGLARERQILSIDGEYYFQEDEQYIQEARQNPNEWTVSPVIGRLFTFDGRLSEKRFWAIRFFIGNPEEGRSFVRIPMGIGTALEHIAKALDWLHMAHHSENSVLEPFHVAAGEPDLLRYYCLTHYISPRLEREYGLDSITRSFVISGILLALICEIPFDHQSVWGALRLYAEKNVQYLCQHMNFPHPSFLFPLFVEAAFSCGVDLSKFDIVDVDDFVCAILRELGLPELDRLRSATNIIRGDVMTFLRDNNLMESVASLLNWVYDSCDKLTWTQRIFSHAFIFPHYSPPVPIIFNDGYYLDGYIFPMESVRELARASTMINNMIRYTVTRNIVDERYSYLGEWTNLSRKKN